MCVYVRLYLWMSKMLLVFGFSLSLAQFLISYTIYTRWFTIQRLFHQENWHSDAWTPLVYALGENIESIFMKSHLFLPACLRVCVRFQFRIHSYTRLRRSCVSVSIVTICQQLTLSRGAHNAKREDSAILLSVKLFLPLFVDTQYCSMLIKKNVKVSVILYTKCVCAPILFFISR